MKAHPLVQRLEQAELTRWCGSVTRISADRIEADGPIATIGDYCEIERSSGGTPLVAEVVAVQPGSLRLAPFGPIHDLLPGATVARCRDMDRIAAGESFAGRAVDALARPIDNGPAILPDHLGPRAGALLPALQRTVARERVATGVRAIDGLLPLGKGQRIGIFAASGVGKTSLIDQLARQIACDRMILCLVGERGREVEKLWRTHLQDGERTRFTLVAATADESASLRVRAIDQALGMAEYWRDRGEHVVLIVDSITRVALALRELGLASGEPPAVRAFTPNVFSALPRIVERCGAARDGGAITAIMTVLSETDDVDDPIVELMKSVLDGHIVLSRSLAERGHFPAIDVARSISRLAGDLFSPPEAQLARKAHAALARFEEARPMIESGLYRKGSNPEVDQAIAWQQDLAAFLRQEADRPCSRDAGFAMLSRICGGDGHAQ